MVSPLVVSGSRLENFTPGSLIRPVAVKSPSLPPRALKDSVCSQIQRYGPVTPMLYVTPFGNMRWRVELANIEPAQPVLWSDAPFQVHPALVA